MSSRYLTKKVTSSFVPGARGSSLAEWEKMILSTSRVAMNSWDFLRPGMLKSGMKQKMTWLGVTRSAM